MLQTQPAERLKAARLQVVDALRGGALLGILVVHCSRWFTSDALPERLFQVHAAGPLNSLFIGKIELLFVDKFYTLFSFLFGLSFALMISRSREAPAVFYRRFLRRLAILGAIGLLHYLHWRGDILIIYAALGLLLLLFNRASNRVVLLSAFVLALNLPVNLTRAYVNWEAPPAQFALRQDAAEAAHKAVANYHTLTHGSYADTVLANLGSFGEMLVFQFSSGRIFQTLGFFLLGLYAGRRQLFQQLEDKQMLFWKLILYAAVALVATKLAALQLTRAYGSDVQAPELIKVGFKVVADLRKFATTLLYIAGLTLLFQSRPGRWVAGPLALVGRMALTNYLLQTLVGSLLFFGYGLGLQGTSQLWAACLLSVPIFLLQVWFSAFWLKRFSYGPVEWAWRSLTLGKAQPLRVPASGSRAGLFVQQGGWQTSPKSGHSA